MADDDIRRLITRCGELKAELLSYAQTKRFDRYREAELRKAADEPDGAPPEPGSDRWITAMDDFVMTFRFPDGTGVIDRFLAARGKELRKADRVLLEGWRDPVDGIFELRSLDKSEDSLTLRNLIDELDYRAYASTPVSLLPAQDGDFVLGRLVPVRPGAWLVSGTLRPFPREHAKVVAQLALEWLAAQPKLAFRNPAKRERGWELMRADRDRFTEFFGSDQVILPPAEALNRLNDYYRARADESERDLPRGDEPFFRLPEEQLKLMTTIGIVYDETDGMSLLPDFGVLEELFADPSQAAPGGCKHTEALISYLDSDSIYPGPLRRLAAAHPDTVDEVYRRVLKKPSFTWEKQGEQLLRKRKPWYFKEDRLPKTTPTSEYLLELLSGDS